MPAWTQSLGENRVNEDPNVSQRRRSIRFARAGHHPGSRQSHRRHSPSADNSRIHVFKGCFWNETCWPQARARHEVPRTSLRCHLHIALPCLHLILRNQPAFANNVAFDSTHHGEGVIGVLYENGSFELINAGQILSVSVGVHPKVKEELEARMESVRKGFEGQTKHEK